MAETVQIEGRKLRKTKQFKHGHCGGHGKKSPTYYTWEKMMERCYNSHHRRYEYYGGRGIKVCTRWHQFKNFLKDMGVRPQDPESGLHLSLDRKDTDGHYRKRNCRWATVTEQNNNQRRHKFAGAILADDDPYPLVCGCGVDGGPCLLHGNEPIPF